MGYLAFLFAKSWTFTLGALGLWAWQEHECVGVGGRVKSRIYEFLENRNRFVVVLVGSSVLLFFIFVFPEFFKLSRYLCRYL